MAVPGHTVSTCQSGLPGASSSGSSAAWTRNAAGVQRWRIATPAAVAGRRAAPDRPPALAALGEQRPAKLSCPVHCHRAPRVSSWQDTLSGMAVPPDSMSACPPSTRSTRHASHAGRGGVASPLSAVPPTPGDLLTLWYGSCSSSLWSHRLWVARNSAQMLEHGGTLW